MENIQSELKEKITELCSLMSVSGFEKRSTKPLKDMIGKDFDEMQTDAVGNHIFIKKCKRENAPLCLVDAHFDEVGMMVTEICEGGFLKFTGIGGLSLAILQGADVIIYGKEALRGVITSTPPHLRDGSDKLADITELLIDTGYTKERLSEIVTVGTPIGFAPVYRELKNLCLAGKSLDDKACGAICARAIANTKREALQCDVALCFSCFEETSRLGGVAPAVYVLSPDYAMVTDVNLAKVPDTERYETVPFAEGISISVSPSTDMRLTRMTEELCKEKGIPYSISPAAHSTGTNSPTVNLVGEGIPVVDIGLPLKNMHTYNETLSLDDAKALYDLVSAFITDKKLSEAFARGRKELPV